MVRFRGFHPQKSGNDAMNLLPDVQQFKYRQDPKIVIGSLAVEGHQLH
jgi:hypothetical protein